MRRFESCRGHFRTDLLISGNAEQEVFFMEVRSRCAHRGCRTGSGRRRLRRRRHPPRAARARTAGRGSPAAHIDPCGPGPSDEQHVRGQGRRRTVGGPSIRCFRRGHGRGRAAACRDGTPSFSGYVPEPAGAGIRRGGPRCTGSFRRYFVEFFRFLILVPTKAPPPPAASASTARLPGLPLAVGGLLMRQVVGVVADGAAARQGGGTAERVVGVVAVDEPVTAVVGGAGGDASAGGANGAG